ncbi:Neuronal acetylcholine receptor subunit alpha-7 [Bagarius yarrelli]|uniref:Neuronal acetylcholine receptor subunit alpha-7 n=1 Tax=Bagarius yarrelli TaxID=175774 RepID=A0A556U8F6_BAGYA|nr:Neuronal acetylcholine receptor subunit alpha-7 [Bagarius yarrelli]
MKDVKRCYRSVERIRRYASVTHDEKNQVLVTNAWLQLAWTDVYLSWNPENYPGVNNLRFPSSQIWTPDILLYNSADERFDATFHTNVLVNSSGACQYIPPGILKSTCYIDVRWFPFDVQKCDLKFGSWTYNGWLLDLQMQEVDISTYIPNGEWDLVGVPGKRNELYYECCKEPYPDVTYTVTIRRRTLYYGLNLLIPCVLISGLALLVFLLPADSGEKISLGITVLLSLTVFMLLVAEIMPATSDSVPLIGTSNYLYVHYVHHAVHLTKQIIKEETAGEGRKWCRKAQYFASTMMIVGLSVVVTVLVLQFHHHDPHGGKMPKWVRVILLQWCAWFLRMKKPGDERKTSYSYSSTSSLQMGSVPSQMGTNGHTNLYFGFHSPDSTCCPNSSDSGVSCGVSCSAGHREAAPAPSGEQRELQKLLVEVSYLAQRFRSLDEAEAVRGEWKFAAAVVDRLCLVAFSLFSIVCTFAILMSAPNFIEAVSKDFT